jgi:hypothetical protein
MQPRGTSPRSFYLGPAFLWFRWVTSCYAPPQFHRIVECFSPSDQQSLWLLPQFKTVERQPKTPVRLGCSLLLRPLPPSLSRTPDFCRPVWACSPVDWGVKVTRSMNLTLRLRARLETARLARRDISSRSVCNLTEPQRFVIKPTAGGAFGGRSAQRMEEDRAIEGMKNPYITANACSLVGAYCFLSSALSALLRGRKNP